VEVNIGHGSPAKSNRDSFFKAWKSKLDGGIGGAIQEFEKLVEAKFGKAESKSSDSM
jgi:hypothetical protein